MLLQQFRLRSTFFLDCGTSLMVGMLTSQKQILLGMLTSQKEILRFQPQNSLIKPPKLLGVLLSMLPLATNQSRGNPRLKETMEGDW